MKQPPVLAGRSPKKAPAKLPKWRAVEGSTLSEADAQVVGSALQKIADDNQVEDYRSLDKHLVYEAVERDEKHPLRPFVFDADDDVAARMWRIEKCRHLIKAVEILYVEVAERPVYAPMFLNVPDGIVKSPPGERGRRADERRVDLLRVDPAFVSAFTAMTKRLRSLTGEMDRLVSLRKKPPAHMRALVASLRAVIDEYDAVAMGDAAE